MKKRGERDKVFCLRQQHECDLFRYKSEKMKKRHFFKEVN